MPCEILVGEADAKFRALGEQLASGVADARLTVVPGAGHALPRIAPGAVASVVDAA
jgi:pimeloyl-ACP methyl ester carboxylesterase